MNFEAPFVFFICRIRDIPLGRSLEPLFGEDFERETFARRLLSGFDHLTEPTVGVVSVAVNGFDEALAARISPLNNP
jgi:hypothetical protein